MRKTNLFSLIVGLSISLLLNQPAALAEKSSISFVNAKGNISLPRDFRKTMAHLGSWFVPEGGASGFHDVYTEKASIDAYRKTGEFPNGATLVKELRASHAGTYTTGANVSYATGDIKQWFVMVKNSDNEHSENPLWGEGWGWALFKPDDPTNNLATDYKVDCLGCHVPAKATDWIYTQAYPTLNTVK